MRNTDSKEYLNALVDGELTAAERNEALARFESDGEFKSAVCELRTLKELVQGAYADIPVHKAPAVSRCPPGWRQALVAGLLLTLGLGGGWLAHGQAASGMPGAYVHVSGLPAGYTPVSLATRVDPDKLVLHLDSADPTRFASVLEMADSFLQVHGAKARVEVVANSDGLNLLRADTTPYRATIDRLSREYDNLSFLACGQTVARLKREGVNVVLIPEADTTSSAISEILDRMRQGWVYVKV